MLDTKHMEGSKSIRAVHRAFEVLRALESFPDGATLAELRAATSLTGPTLLRLLRTLQEEAAVFRGLHDQRWRNSLRLDRLTRQLDPVRRLAEIAAPWLDDLCTKVQWPSDLAIHASPDDDFMTILETTLRRSPFYVRRSAEHGKVNLMMSALGLAYLSQLPRDRVDGLVSSVRRSLDVHNRKSANSTDLHRRLLQARQRGYATRHASYRGGQFEGTPADDQLGAIAVPLIAAGKLMGAVNINWNRQAATERSVVANWLPRLVEAAEGIAADATWAGLPEHWRAVQSEDCTAAPIISSVASPDGTCP